MGFSEKQREILRFPYRPEYQALICDGAVRSGKTSVMSLSFFCGPWAALIAAPLPFVVKASAP